MLTHDTIELLIQIAEEKRLEMCKLEEEQLGFTDEQDDEHELLILALDELEALYEQV